MITCSSSAKFNTDVLFFFVLRWHRMNGVAINRGETHANLSCYTNNVAFNIFDYRKKSTDICIVAPRILLYIDTLLRQCCELSSLFFYSFLISATTGYPE